MSETKSTIVVSGYGRCGTSMVMQMLSAGAMGGGIASAIARALGAGRHDDADALEEAGCDNIDILLHCREPGTHVRGCWVVDLVLGKQ